MSSELMDRNVCAKSNEKYCRNCEHFFVCANVYGEVDKDTAITNIKGDRCFYYSPGEYTKIFEYIRSADLSDKTQLNQLISLWTAHCIHSNMDVDTGMYDYKMREIWSLAKLYGDVELIQTPSREYSIYEQFYNVMSRDLI